MRLDRGTKEFDILLKSCLHTEQTPDDALHQKVMQEWKEQKDMNKKRSYKVAIATAVGIIALSGISVSAAKRFFTPKEITSELGYEDVAALFEKEGAVAVNMAQEGKDYNFTLLGMTEGKDFLTLDDVDSEGIERNSFYAVVAISNKDGSKLSIEDFRDSTDGYFISPLIQGYEPWKYNMTSMNGGYGEMEKDGVVYRLIQCDEVSYFADRELYLCISDSMFYNIEAYNYDEETGVITPDADYEGTNILFKLPIDKSKADPDKAEEYIRKLREKRGDDADGDEEKAPIEDLDTEDGLTVSSEDGAFIIREE